MPPRLIALGFQLPSGKLVGPREMFDVPSFDEARRMADEIAYILRHHDLFETLRLALEEVEYTTMPAVMRDMAA